MQLNRSSDPKFHSFDLNNRHKVSSNLRLGLAGHFVTFKINMHLAMFISGHNC